MLRGGVLVPGDVWVRDGRIVDPQKLFYDEKRGPDRVVDCRELIVAPGFIDLQINGEGVWGGSTVLPVMESDIYSQSQCMQQKTHKLLAILLDKL